MAPKYLNKIEGQLVVIIGGTSGIGFCLAEASVEHGAHVVIASRSQEKVDAAIQRLKASYPDAADRVRGHPCDIGKLDVEAQLEKLFEFATNNGKEQIDHVVDTAGDASVIKATDLSTTTPDSLLEGQRLRYVGSLMTVKHMLKHMRSASSSSYTMTSGVSAWRPFKGLTVTLGGVATKEMLTRSLAVDLAPIRVNLVSPGAVKTDLLDAVAAGIGQDMEPVWKSASLLNEIGTPEDCAEAYLYCMKNRFVTGTVLQSEGGWLLK